MRSSILRIAIIGCGLSGAAAAIALLRKVSAPFEVVAVEPAAQLGRGIAYGKADPFHLLNVRAGKLGVLPDEPDDFALWARGASTGVSGSYSPFAPTRAFLPRQMFGAYVEQRLAESVASRRDAGFTHLDAEAKRIRRSAHGYEIELDRRQPICAEIVILATGYGRPSPNGRFGQNPFADLDLRQLHAARSALFVGTGLSFVDAFLRLRSRGFQGDAFAVSRRGLLPEVHRVNEAPRRIARKESATDLGSLFALFRSAMRRSELPTSTAIDLILGLRDELPSLWQSLDVVEQRRFLRHLMPLWTSVRHRMPPEVHVQIAYAMKHGILRIAAGRASVSEGGGEPHIRLAGGKAAEGSFDLVLDCTGHRPDVASPLVGSLVGEGLARIDPHRLGLSVARNGALLERHGSPSPTLFALGPLGQGTLFEITAIPEIVAQCAAMAEALEERFRRNRRPEVA